MTDKAKELIYNEVTVTVFGKDIRDNSLIEIKQEDLDLLKQQNEWPIEGDTLDIREHEFNFKK